MFAVSVASKCEVWEFQDDVVLLGGFLEQYYIGLGGGGKVFQDVEFSEREVLDMELEYHEVLTFGIGWPP